MPYDKPRVFLTDNGSEFKNEDFEKFCSSFNIKHHFCIPHHPQSDGVVERFNRTLIALLKAYVSESGADWPLFLQKVVAAYNSTEHPLKGISPYAALMKVDKPSTLFSVKNASEVCDYNEFVQFREWMAQYAEATNEWGDHAANSSRKGKPSYQVGDLL
jgi:transposase InsO family protein